MQRKEISMSLRHITRRSLSSMDIGQAAKPTPAMDADTCCDVVLSDEEVGVCVGGGDSVECSEREGTPDKVESGDSAPVNGFSSRGLESSRTSNGTVNTALLRNRMRKLWGKEVMKLVFLLAPIWELLMSGLTISWHNETAPITDDMKMFLKIGTVICTINFGAIWLASFEALFFEAWVDIIFVAVSILTTLWWCKDNTWGDFNTLQICAFLGLSIYRGFRTWTIANSSVNESIQTQVVKLGVSSVLATSSMKLVWICRDAALVEFLWPEIDAYWVKLQKSWGKHAEKVINIRVYVTTPDRSAQVHLKRAVQGSSLYAAGALNFGRPDVFDTIQCQLLNRVKDDAQAGGVSAASSTLVAFCGSPSLGSIVGKAVMDVQIIAEATKHGHHTMSFYQENYGITRSRSPRMQGATSLGDGPIARAMSLDDRSVSKTRSLRELGTLRSHVYRHCRSADEVVLGGILDMGGGRDEDLSNHRTQSQKPSLESQSGVEVGKNDPTSGMPYY